MSATWVVSIYYWYFSYKFSHNSHSFIYILKKSPSCFISWIVERQHVHPSSGILGFSNLNYGWDNLTSNIKWTHKKLNISYLNQYISDNSFPLQNVIFFTFTGETLQVKVFVLHPEDLAFTWLPALVALNQGLLAGVVVCVLGMRHCSRWKNKRYYWLG